MRFRFSELGLSGMVLVEAHRFEDERGFFQETYRKSAFQEGAAFPAFVQDNFARSARGVLRGIHFQLPPHPQGKLVWCPLGKIWDVGVDLREGSPTYGAWSGVELSEDSATALYLPPGFGHGYVVLSEMAFVHYKTTSEYHPELDAGIRWDCPDLGIEWPVSDPLLSPKDRDLPPLSRIDPPFPPSPRGRSEK